jgi:hypothetical protein
MSEVTLPRQQVDRAPRSRVLHGGKLIVSDGQSVIDCVVRNTGKEGVLVRLSIPTVLPTHIELLILKNNTIYPVEVRWNRNSEAGLRFTGPGRVTAHCY